ncbi:MAG: hypothetical protein H6659_14005 [Ardenticatenaceae bacterium]|nr:hypothetical protein [Ardenticatenaceae bacterium]MCB8988584.1 hypothetical protein [Ardenticatenaceae bacterium]
MSESLPEPTGERLYNLLPALYRRRDAASGQPLRALLAVIEAEMDRLESDIEAAYDNWFIETCDEWVVPYLADLVGIDDLVDGVLLPGQRRRVANQSAYQRRKGLAAVLTHVIHDVTGWHAYAVETGRLAARTPDVRLVQPGHGGTLDLRQAAHVASLGTPFDTAVRTMNLRRIEAGRHGRSRSGRPHLNAIALFLWRLPSFPIRYAQAGVSPRVLRGENTRHFTFDPLGRDVPLFVDPVTPEDIDQPLRPEHFPLPLTRAMLAADLERPEPRLYGPEKSVAVWVNGRLLPATSVISGDMGLGTAVWLPVLAALGKEAVIDVRRGQIMLANYAPREGVTVTYAVGFSSSLGCGPHGRVLQPEIPPDTLLIEVRHDSPETMPFAADAGHLRPVLARSLAEALAAWDAFCAHQVDHPCAVVRFLDSAIYQEEALVVNLPSGSQLTIEAANGLRPVIQAESCRIGPPRLGLESLPEAVVYDRRLLLNGLLLACPLQGAALGGGKLDLALTRCTLPGGLDLQAAGMTLNVNGRDVLVGDVALAAENGRLSVKDSIVDGRIATDQAAELARVTVLGSVAAGRLAALDDAIVVGRLAADSVDEGALHHSYVGWLAAEMAAEFCVVGREERPFFVSRRAAHPEFARLDTATSGKIREGASNGAEMGAFNNLHNFQRRINLAHVLPDYVPLGQAVGVFYET